MRSGTFDMYYEIEVIIQSVIVIEGRMPPDRYPAVYVLYVIIISSGCRGFPGGGEYLPGLPQALALPPAFAVSIC